jgi:hypothetical protein
MAEISEPVAMMATLLSKVIDDIKGSRPAKSDGSPLDQGYVFAQLPLGQLVDPVDYAGAWTPMGGTPPNAAAGAVPPATTPVASGANSASATAAASATKEAMKKAFNTAQLADTMLQITTDGTYREYPTGRHLSFAYGEILQAMEAPAPPPRSPREQAAIAAANKVLYVAGFNGLPSPTPMYSRYTQNAMAYAQAKANFSKAQAKALTDPASADTWPMESAPLQAAVDDAWNTWKSEGADEIEAALATVESLGIPLEQGAIAKARQTLDAWSLSGLSGVTTKTPYCAVNPSEWADPSVDNIGWTHVTIESSDYHSHWEEHGGVVSTGDWSSNSSSSSGEAGISVFGFGFAGSASSSSSDSQSHSRTDSFNGMQFHNDAKNLTIDLEYGLCQIERPWLMTDLFYMKNYWVKGNKKHTVSDGTNNPAVQNLNLLALLPTHMLVIRRVNIRTTEWNNDGATLDKYFNQFDSKAHAESSGESGGGFACLGVVNLGGGGGHSETHEGGSSSDQSGSDHWSDFGGSFKDNVLTINGSQIAAWLCEVIPAAAPLDDPDMDGSGSGAADGSAQVPSTPAPAPVAP